MGRIHAAGAGRGLHVHTIAFGSANRNKLSSLATICHGTFHAAPDPASLQTTFACIANAAGAPDGLVAQFAQYVTDNVTDKLVMEYM